MIPAMATQRSASSSSPSNVSPPNVSSSNVSPSGASQPTRSARVLVAIDSSPDGQLALELAAALAAQWPETAGEPQAVELCGVFVDDDALRGAAALPFVHEIALHSAVTRRLELSAIEQWLERIADRLRESLAAAARDAAVRWSFMVRRGRAAQVRWELTRDADWVIVGGHSLSPSVARPRMGGSSRRASAPPLLVVHDGSAASTRLLDNAARLAQRRQTRIELFLAQSDDSERAGSSAKESLARLQQRVVSELAALRVAGFVHPTPLRSAADLMAMARIWRPQLILVAASSGLIDADSLELLVLEHHGPIALLV